MLKRFGIGALVIIALSAAATATATLLEISDDVSILKQGAKIPGITGVLDNVDGGGAQTVLILGSDRRFVDIKDHNPARSDTILLVRLDPSKAATTVMSIPRDLMVDIPGFGRDKINAAYADGGPRLTVQTIRNLFHFPINHVVNVNFGGFREAVDRLGCVYIDVDRRYFNDNDPPAGGGGGNYATIDIQPGYQKLCGSDALDYVRFRHLDTDFVRAARQQDFLRQAKDQLGLGRLFSTRKELLRIFARYTQTDIRSTPATLRLIKLAFESAKNPIREVHFRGDLAGDSTFSYVDITPENLARTRREFLNPPPAVPSVSSTRHHKRSAGALAPGVIPDGRAARAYVRAAAHRLRFPLLYARHRLAAGSYATDPPRVYTIRDRAKHRYRAYRIVVQANGLGQYYGIQGTTWQQAPILDHPSETRAIGGRRFDLYFDGRRLRLVAFRTPRAAYWVSNTLLETLTNRQMLDIAGSLARAGG